MAKSVQQHQSRPTDTHTKTSHKRDRSDREAVDQAKCQSQSHRREEDADPPQHKVLRVEVPLRPTRSQRLRRYHPEGTDTEL